MQFKLYSVGIDTAYSQKSADTFALTYGGLTDNGVWVVLDNIEYNNRDLNVPLTPSDMVAKIDAFIIKNSREWGFTRNVFIDSADQGTILEMKKYTRDNGRSYNIYNSYKKTSNVDRVNLMNGWLAQDYFKLVKGRTEPLVKNMNAYSWNETKDIPEDANDHNIQGVEYGWLPYKDKIGRE